MNSFLYNDPYLFNRLISIAQQEPAIEPTQMYAAALQAIQNAKTQSSSLKANENPTFNDIQTLNQFKSWAMTHMANDNGKPLVDAMSKEFNPDVLQKFLTDLRDRVSNNPTFSEGVAGLIEEANKMPNIKIPPYTHEQTQKEQTAAGEKLTPAPGGSKLQLSTRFPDQDGKPEVESGTPTQAPQQQPQQQSGPKPPSFEFLDGNMINLQVIAQKARDITDFYKRANPELFIALNGVANEVQGALRHYNDVSQKSSGRAWLAVPVSIDQGQLETVIKTSYQTASRNQYTFKDLELITRAYISMLSSVVDFCTILKSFSSGSTALIPVLDKQIERANEYLPKFGMAATHFSNPQY